MKSLATVVAILFITALLSGPIALGLTFTNPHSRKLRLIRRFFVTIFAFWGILNGLQLSLASIPLISRLIGVMSVLTSAFALMREFRSRNVLGEE